MKNSSVFIDGYNSFVEAFGGEKVFQADNYVSKVHAEIDKLQNDLNSFSGNNQIPNILKGDIAEFWHSGTHNIDAAVKDVNARTYVNASERGNLGSIDIKGNFGKDYGLKYYKDGIHSAKEQSLSFFEKYQKGNFQGTMEEYYEKNNMSVNDSNKHSPLYGGQQRLIPVEQVEEATVWLKRQIAKESVTRPELAEKYKETLKLLTDRIKSNEGSESIPLTNAEATEIAKLAKTGAFKASDSGLTTEDLIEFQYIMQQSLKAGLSAATISMVLRIAPELFKLLQKATKEENVTTDDLKKLGFSAVQGGSEGFIRGGIAAGITTACLSGQLGSFLKSVDPTIIGAVTVITLNAIKNSIKVARKEMTNSEFVNACMRDLFVSTCSLALGGVTQGFIHIPVFGYMIGSFIGSITASFMYDTAYKSFLSFCCETGFTFFGLVDQNYELPKDVLTELGIHVFEYDKFVPKTLQLKTLKTKQLELKKLSPKIIEFTFLRRGVIGVNKIGYA
jgi:hypothetical protein